MNVVSYSRGTAPLALVVVRGTGRALNPTARSGKPTETNLSAHNYDNIKARHRSGVQVNNFRTEAFDTPVSVWEKNTGWLTVSGGKDGLTVTYAPGAVVVYAEVVDKEGNMSVVMGISLKDYMDTYC
jgi:hypothetical protein